MRALREGSRRGVLLPSLPLTPALRRIWLPIIWIVSPYCVGLISMEVRAVVAGEGGHCAMRGEAPS